MNSRGQTAYDYLLGVVLLLVAIITVLSLFPQFFDPFVDPVSTDREKMADRVADDVIETNATAEGERSLDINGLDVDKVKTRAGVNEYRSVNVSFRTKDGETIGSHSYGDRRLGENPSATAVRTVRIVNEPRCEFGCQLVVRVW